MPLIGNGIKSKTAGKSGLNNRIYQPFYVISKKYASIDDEKSEFVNRSQVLCKLKKTDIRYVISYFGQSRFLRFCPCLYYNAVSGHVKQSWLASLA